MQRTRRTLREALIGLLLERDWDEIRVQDVCDRADVGRSTFYMHFADKEDLLIGGFDDLRQAMRQQPTPAGARPSLPFARPLIEHAHEHQRLFRALVGRRSGHLVVGKFRELVLELVHEDVAALAPAGPARDATVHFIAGGFFELLTWWLEAPSTLEPADIERLFLRMAAPALRALQRSRG